MNMKSSDNQKEYLTGVDLSKCRILVIDDSEDTRTLFEMGGKTRGYQVTLCRNGQDGLAKLRDTSNHYDVVFLDLVLPDSDGLEILREIKRERPDFNVVIITAYYHEKVDSAVPAIKEGADDYIEKPFGIDEIVSHTNKSIQFRRLKGKLSESTVKITQLIRTTSNLQEIMDYAVQSLADIPIIVGASIHHKIDERLELKATSGSADGIEKQEHDFQTLIRQYAHDSTPQFKKVDFRDAPLGWTCIPLFHERWGVLGVVNIYHQLEPHINIREWRIAQAFLRQVTVALALFGELQIANQIIAEMGREEDIGKALEILLQRCIEMFNGNRGSIFIFDDRKLVQVGKDKKAEVSLVSYWNHDWNLKEEGTMEKLAAECLVTKGEIERFINNDLSDDPKKKNIYATFFKKKVRSVITTGIFIEDNLLGALTIAANGKDAFTDDQLQFLRTICNHISPHIISARQRTIDRKINELNRFLNDLDVRSEGFLNRFTQEVVNVLECEGCNLYLLGEDNRYELKASNITLLNGEMPDIPSGFRPQETPSRSGLLCWVVAERNSLRLNHPRQFEEFLRKNPVMPVRPDDEKFPYWQFLGIPVVLGGECIAVIEAAQYIRPKTPKCLDTM